MGEVSDSFRDIQSDPLQKPPPVLPEKKPERKQDKSTDGGLHDLSETILMKSVVEPSPKENKAFKGDRGSTLKGIADENQRRVGAKTLEEWKSGERTTEGPAKVEIAQRRKTPPIENKTQKTRELIKLFKAKTQDAMPKLEVEKELGPRLLGLSLAIEQLKKNDKNSLDLEDGNFTLVKSERKRSTSKTEAPYIQALGTIRKAAERGIVSISIKEHSQVELDHLLERIKADPVVHNSENKKFSQELQTAHQALQKAKTENISKTPDGVVAELQAKYDEIESKISNELKELNKQAAKSDNPQEIVKLAEKKVKQLEKIQRAFLIEKLTVENMGYSQLLSYLDVQRRHLKKSKGLLEVEEKKLKKMTKKHQDLCLCYEKLGLLKAELSKLEKEKAVVEQDKNQINLEDALKTLESSLYKNLIQKIERLESEILDLEIEGGNTKTLIAKRGELATASREQKRLHRTPKQLEDKKKVLEETIRKYDKQIAETTDKLKTIRSDITYYERWLPVEEKSLPQNFQESKRRIAELHRNLKTYENFDQNTKVIASYIKPDAKKSAEQQVSMLSEVRRKVELPAKYPNLFH